MHMLSFRQFYKGACTPDSVLKCQSLWKGFISTLTIIRKWMQEGP